MVIKQSYTFRRKLELGELVSVLHTLVSDWSEEDDRLLESSRLSLLHNEINSLSLRTDGYQFFKSSTGKDSILRIKIPKIITLHQSHQNLI